MSSAGTSADASQWNSRPFRRAKIACGFEATSSIRLSENLTKPGGPDSGYWLSFGRFEVKNAVQLQFSLDETVTAIAQFADPVIGLPRQQPEPGGRPSSGTIAALNRIFGSS